MLPDLGRRDQAGSVDITSSMSRKTAWVAPYTTISQPHHMGLWIEDFKFRGFEVTTDEFRASIVQQEPIKSPQWLPWCSARNANQNLRPNPGEASDSSRCPNALIRKPPSPTVHNTKPRAILRNHLTAVPEGSISIHSCKTVGFLQGSHTHFVRL